MKRNQTTFSVLQSHLHQLKDDADLDALISEIGDARVVMLGEASHGTHEYYTWRSRISRRLIKEKGFNFISVEGDWPPCYKVNRFIKNYSDAGDDVVEVLKSFSRWPTWMWANWEVAALTSWLRKYNKELSLQNRVGFYGLDVYSLWESMDEIIKYLEKEDPEAAQIAKKSVRCFDPYKGDEQQYAWATRMVPTSCEKEVLEMLNAIVSRSARYDTDIEAPFNTEQNAIVAVNAEKYYRAMVQGGAESWNVRDHHMMQTLDRLLRFHGPESKAIVWEHNTHIGDARYTDMRNDAMENIGQLAREAYGEDDVKLVGFGSYEGSVIAGDAWGAPFEKMPVPPGRRGSWEEMLNETEEEQFYLLSSELTDTDIGDVHIPHRAIGVVYHPEREAYGNYVPSAIGRRYDAFIHINNTRALHPLDIEKEEQKVPETYPWNF